MDDNIAARSAADSAASKAAIAQAIAAKGVTVPEGAKLADLSPLVGQISGGGGGRLPQPPPQVELTGPR